MVQLQISWESSSEELPSEESISSWQAEQKDWSLNRQISYNDFVHLSEAKAQASVDTVDAVCTIDALNAISNRSEARQKKVLQKYGVGEKEEI